MGIYSSIVRSLAFRLDPERAHHLAMGLGARAAPVAELLRRSLIYEGPVVVRRITRGLAVLLERDGFASVAAAVGADAP